MKKIAGFILCVSIVLNSGIAAFSAVMPYACVKPAVYSDSSHLSKLIGSVLQPLENMNRQIRDNNPFVPNLAAMPNPSTTSDGKCPSVIITTNDNNSLNMRQNNTAAQGIYAHGFNPLSFGAPRIFPPPGLVTSVNSLYLQYLVFLAKSNLPWTIDFPYKG